MQDVPTRRLDLASAEEECGDSALDRVRRAYEELAPGERMEVLTLVAEQAFAVRAWSRTAGADLIGESREQGRARLVVGRPTG